MNSELFKRTWTWFVRLTILALAGALAFVTGKSPIERKYVDIANDFRRPPADATHVLFVGNSHLYVHEVPHIVQRLVPDGEPPLAFDALLAAGVRLEWHVTEGDVARFARSNDYDVVVLQPQSTELLENQPNFAAQVQALDAAGGDARTVLMQTWPRDHRDEWAKAYAPLPAEWNEHTWATAQGAWETSPVGNVWLCTFDKTRIDLWSHDGNHASIAGAFVAALVLYRTIRGPTARWSQRAPPGMPDSIAQTLRDAVDACLD